MSTLFLLILKIRPHVGAPLEYPFRNEYPKYLSGMHPVSKRLITMSGSALSSACNRLFGARFSAATVQLCRQLVIAFLGLGEKPPRLRFVVESPFWGQVRSCHGSTLSSTRLAFLKLGEKPPRFNFVESPCLFGVR
jgi:hypothetical protein